MTNEDVQQLINAVRSSTRSKTILVPCNDYYARPGDSTESLITYVDGDVLRDELEKLL